MIYVIERVGFAINFAFRIYDCASWIKNCIYIVYSKTKWFFLGLLSWLWSVSRRVFNLEKLGRGYIATYFNLLFVYIPTINLRLYHGLFLSLTALLYLSHTNYQKLFVFKWDTWRQVYQIPDIFYSLIAL